MFRKPVYLFALMAVLFAQLVIAQHYTVHASHDLPYVEHAHNDGHDHDDPKPLAEKLCDICLLNQNLAHGLVSLQSDIFSTLSLQGSVVFISNEAPHSFAVSHFKQARAPPSFLV